MITRLTPRAQKVMVLANEKARQLNHEYIGTEHILLGLVEEGGGVGANVLKVLLNDLGKVQREVEKLVKRGPDSVAEGNLPQTPRAKKVIEHAIEKAHELHHKYLGTEHLLLGLLHEGEGIAAQVLMNLGLTPEAVNQEVSKLSDISDRDKTTKTQELSKQPLAAPEAVEYVQRLLKESLRVCATDIHIDPTEDGRGLVRIRIDNVLHKVDSPPEGTLSQVVDHIKTMGAMNIEERRMPQNGVCIMNLDGVEVRIPLSSVPSYYGERIVLRVIRREVKDIPLGLTKLGLTDDNLDKVRKLCHLPNGLVIVNGPAGSGKTILLYSMLMELDHMQSSIMTVEDPVELAIPGIAQIAIRPQIGLTYARAIRSVLGQIPNVIMVGEIRDLEVLHLCVQAALTGHLVLTTLRAVTLPGAIRQLLDMGIEPFLVNSTLAAVISQKLVHKLCSKCKQPAQLPPEHSMPLEAVRLLSNKRDVTFYGPNGCEHCWGTGYYGRMAIQEILIMDDRIRQLVTNSLDLTALRQAAIENGMKTLLTNGLEKAIQGITSIEEVLRVTTGGVNI